MPVFNFKPRKIAEHLEEGSYCGVIEKVEFNENGGYFSLDIKLESGEVFIAPFHMSNIVFNNFAIEFVDENGCFNSDNIIDTTVEFSVVDKAGTKRSKVTAITVAE